MRREKRTGSFSPFENVPVPFSPKSEMRNPKRIRDSKRQFPKLHDRRSLFCALGLVLILATVASGQQVAAEQDAKPGAGSPPMAMVILDEDTAAQLARAQELIAGGHFDDASRVLLHIMDRPDAGFVAADEPGRFTSLASRAAQVIANLPPDGLERYRRLCGPQAATLLERAWTDRDAAALRQVVNCFPHTGSADRAANLLGSLLLDRGQFHQAARCWQDLLARRADGHPDAPVLLAKLAVAYHLAGDPAKAAEAAARLVKEHPDAQADLAGQRRPVAAFVAGLLAAEPARGPGQPAVPPDWTSLAGSPDGAAVMSSPGPVGGVSWTRPGGRLDDNVNVEAHLTHVHGPRVYDPRGAPKVVLKGGRVEAETGPIPFGTSAGAKFILPPLIHPIVVGQAVICRNADGVTACDLLSGRTIWSSVAFRLYRQPPISPQLIYAGYYGVPGGQDDGHWTLSAAEDRVFAVGRFLPSGAREVSLTYRQYSARGRDDTSALAAFSISGQGRLLWLVGGGSIASASPPSAEGDADILRDCRFMAAPTPARRGQGRLYVTVEYRQGCHLLCLSAGTGALVWKAVVGRVPAPFAGEFSRPNYRPPIPGSPPAVADGRVVAVTNAGVVAAFEADSGRALWASQYDVRPDSLPVERAQDQVTAPTVFSPNPVIVMGDRVICLPTDSSRVLALDADTGRRLWQTDRQGLNDLSAMSGGRVAVSGPDMMFLDAATGKVQWRAGRDVQDILGRPAVTADAVLASGSGRLIRVSLPDNTVSAQPVPPEGILGNLVSAGGRLLAANAAGVSSYGPAAE